MNYFSLLVVDDDDLILQSIRMALPESWKMVGANSPQEIPKQKFQAAFVDMHLTNNGQPEGLEVIRQLHDKYPHLEIIAMSGDLDRELMEKCLRAGASRYLAKPLSTDELLMILDKVEAWLLLQNAGLRTKNKVHWVGTGKSSQKIQKEIASLRGEKGPILLEGESGTGKEVVSQLIHDQEGSDRPYICVNVAAIPENLFESEVFGHVRGAFTGADQNKMGLAEAATGGDLFLDEIEALSLPLQAKLLRFLETGEVRRVGSSDSIQVDVRVIAATNKNLNKMVSEDTFREDLLWRISGKKIDLPPLRERSEDIQDLCQFFFSKDSSRKKELEPEAVTALKEYSWPGNVRELRRICEQLLMSAPLPVIRPQDLVGILQPRSQTANMNQVDFSKGLPQIIEEFEAQVIANCLNQYNDVDETAKLLKISRSSLYKKIKDHNIDWRS